MKGLSTSDSALAGYVIRSSGQSSRATPFIELQCAQTGCTSEESTLLISKAERTTNEA
jgi:hypothetical protein